MEEEFEVKGRHEHALEHASEHGVPLAQKVAVFSAVLATFGAVISFLAGHTQNEALYHKNEAVLLKAKASDTWAYYQAESGKQHLAALAAELVPAARKKDFQGQVGKYAAKKADLQRRAEKLDAGSEDANKEAERALSPHNKLAMAMTFIQIAIALASIAALTRRTWLLAGAGVGAVLGAAFAALAFLV
ncbi:MAG TPA: DUF4337 family protein [Allosphingosinicella sp.]